MASFLPLLRTNFYISKHENLSNYLLRYYGGSNSLHNAHELSANTAESPWTDCPLQATKAVHLMVTNYTAKRKPCSDCYIMRIVSSVFLKSHLKKKNLRYLSYLLSNTKILYLVISIITIT